MTAVTVRREPHLLVRILWFLGVGWWLSGVVIALAWLLNLTIVGFPLSIWLVNRIPFVATLKSSPEELRITTGTDGEAVVTAGSRRQRPFLLRTLYFLLVGWWASGLWLSAAWFLTVIIVGIPLAFWMYGATGTVTTLKR